MSEPTFTPLECAEQFELYAANTPIPEKRQAYTHAARFIREFCSLENQWHKVALACGLYPAKTDVSTPEKWEAAQSKAASNLISRYEAADSEASRLRSKGMPVWDPPV